MNECRITIVASLLLACAAPALAQDKPAAKAPPPAAEAAKDSPPVEYRPPSRGAPRVRVGGSTRSAARGLSLVVVAPDHTGLASSSQPELFWYISQPVQAPLEFAIYPVDAADPLAEKAIAPVSEAGIQRIRLSEMGVKLESGEEYQWVISFAHKPGSRVKDAVASGRVRVQPLPADVHPAIERIVNGCLAPRPQDRFATAEQLGLSPLLMAAANSSGGVMGKMIDAQSIVVASTATQWFGHEGEILRYVFFHSVALAALVGVLITLQAYVAPFTLMVVGR